MIIKLTNGAAKAAYEIVTSSTPKMEDLFTSGKLAILFKKAKSFLPLKDETNGSFNERFDEWASREFGDTELDEAGRDYLRATIKKMATDCKLPGNEHVMNLAIALDLDKP